MSAGLVVFLMRQAPHVRAGVTKFLKPSVAGFLLQKELDYLDGAVAQPKRPFVAIVGGSKVSSKIGVIESLINKVDKIILGCVPAPANYLSDSIDFYPCIFLNVLHPLEVSTGVPKCCHFDAPFLQVQWSQVTLWALELHSGIVV